VLKEGCWIAERGDGTHRTSIVRASEDARRARSFSRAGGSTGVDVLPLPSPLAAAAAEDDIVWWCSCSNSAEWIADCGALSGRRRVVKRFGGRANARVYNV
jgi:hypothetical protein